MRAIVQRVSKAEVSVADSSISSIGYGLVVYIGVGQDDSRNDAEWIANKLANLRIFEDEQGRMNLSALEISAEILVIPNFTLCGDCRKGRRPGFDAAAEPAMADELYKLVCQMLKSAGISAKNGIFAAHMHVSSTNDGPINILLDSRKKF